MGSGTRVDRESLRNYGRRRMKQPTSFWRETMWVQQGAQVRAPATTPPISQSSFCLLQSLSFMLEDGEAVVTDTQDDDVQPTCEGIRRRVPIADVEEVEQR